MLILTVSDWSKQGSAAEKKAGVDVDTYPATRTAIITLTRDDDHIMAIHLSKQDVDYLTILLREAQGRLAAPAGSPALPPNPKETV